jgi:endonuclease/exonuclease/phosphatase family metal-dependent hydrolase
VVLVNHLKGKFGGNDPTSVGKRRRQAEQVKAIYDGLRRDGVEYVVVLGDFNDTPDSAPLQALLAAPPQGADVTDFVHVADFDDGAPGGERPGTSATARAATRLTTC